MCKNCVLSLTAVRYFLCSKQYCTKTDNSPFTFYLLSCIMEFVETKVVGPWDLNLVNFLQKLHGQDFQDIDHLKHVPLQSWADKLVPGPIFIF